MDLATGIPNPIDVYRRQPPALPVPAPVQMAMNTSTPVLPTPVAPMVAPAPHVPTQMDVDTNELNRIKNTGAGVDQIQNPFLRGLARAGDIAASVFAPGIARSIPGTTLHHLALENRQEQRLAADQKEAKSAADIADVQSQTDQREAMTEQERAKADALRDPKKAVDPSKTVQTDDGVFQLNPDTGKYDIRVGDRVEKPKSIEEQAYEYAVANGKNPLEAYGAVYGAKNQKDANLPQQYLDAIASGDTVKAALIKRTIQDTQVQPKIDVHTATERPESSGTWTPGFDANKNPVEFNNKTGEVRPMASFSKQSAAGNAKISADEQKRADLAQNMNENIDALEDILKRRPELFGPIAGRVTQAKVAFGTDDPDAAKLLAIEHQLGMVAQGAHGMRSAQGVESAAHSLTNGFKNSPGATKAALEAARQSVATFLSDSQNPGQARSAASGPKAGDVVDGYRFKGGDPGDQKNWEKK